MAEEPQETLPMIVPDVDGWEPEGYVRGEDDPGPIEEPVHGDDGTPEPYQLEENEDG